MTQSFPHLKFRKIIELRLARLGPQKMYGLVGEARGLQLKIKRLYRFSRFHIFRKSGSQKIARAISKSTKDGTKNQHRSIGLKNDRQSRPVCCLPDQIVC